MKITESELAYLREAIRNTYENSGHRQQNDNKELNTNKKNYEFLSTELMKLKTDENDFITPNRVHDFLRGINVTFPNKSFLDACYLYTHKKNRDTYLDTDEGSKLYGQWTSKEGLNHLNPDTEIETQKLKELADKEPTRIDAKIEEAQNEWKAEKDAAIKEIENKNSKKIKIIVAVGSCLILLLSGLLWNEHAKRQDAAIWTGMTPTPDSVVVANQVPFLREPNSSFLKAVDTLIQSFQKPQDFVNSQKIKPLTLMDFKELGQQDNLKDGDLTLLSFQNLKGVVDEMAQGASFYLAELSHKNSPENEDTLEKMFGMDKTPFNLRLVYWGYIKDSIKTTYRYPPYRQDPQVYDGYDFEVRQWWKDATDTEGNGYNWTWKRTEKDSVKCGFTKYYQSTNPDNPGKRTFWVKIPMDSAQLVLAIDFNLKQ